MELLRKLFRVVQSIELGLKDPSSDSFWNLFRVVQSIEPGLKDPGSDSFWNLFRVNLGLQNTGFFKVTFFKGYTEVK